MLRASFSQRLSICTLNVCTPMFWVPNTLIEGHIPWLRDPKPKGTKPKGTKENSLIFNAAARRASLNPKPIRCHHESKHGGKYVYSFNSTKLLFFSWLNQVTSNHPGKIP